MFGTASLLFIFVVPTHTGFMEIAIYFVNAGGKSDLVKVMEIKSVCQRQYEPHHEKSDFCICENKGTDQLCCNCTSNQHLCFCYMDRMIPSLLILKISRF